MAFCTVVTGAAGGIGQAVVECLKRKGEAVLPVDRAGVGDLAEPDAVGRVADAVHAAGFEGVRGFVHAAGFDLPAPLGLVQPDDLARLTAVHAGFPLAFFGWWMKKGNHAPDSAAVLISSLAARTGAVGHAAYAAAKGAVEGLLRPAAAELAARHMRLNAVIAGIVRTPMSESWLAKIPAEARASEEAAYPFGFGSPESLADAISFLLSPAAGWITGQTLVCDGGRSLSI